MALVRVAQYGSVPGPVTDYQAQNAHLQAFTNQLLTQQFILDSGTGQPVIKQGCYVSHGGSLYVADADTAITGSPSDGSVYIRVSGSTSLTVEFVTDISGYAWNPVYSALTSGSYTLLPYLIFKESTVWTRYNFNPNNQQFGSLASLAVTGNATVGGTLGVTGAISGASINTGDGAIKLYSMGVENISVTATSGRSSVTIADKVIGKEVFVNMVLTSANGFDAEVYLPPTGKYVLSGGVYNGGEIIAIHYSSSTTPSTETRMELVRRIE